ncbi:MAG: phosphoribosylaminoimidazolesuccinocarboxamide synthase [Omnitrophica bacterium RIFCSPHIGHO2_02_FULL_46_11]|nr:MAG: phosphoribosylaminoimidazolesuccinocarboxamide synthase [Omnitrophica bacterium RIFCSPHIGHO2_02_FULL_46_11]OGW86763.1 MAG: phosphoribosylaminoimidazolesuccinocarboxamide synthase [Omnitrophica bacterium RIFCSPLOWO2_01_FULL_45_10b]
MVKTLWESHLPLPLVGRGKVRDIYEVGPDKLLIVASDRLSAFDVVLPNPIPFKGEVLTQISVFWFEFVKNVTPHHLITADVNQMDLPQKLTDQFSQYLKGRSMLVKRTVPFMAECVVRGYLTGSGWKDYLKTGSVCGHKLPRGLSQCQKLPTPLFTPATKATTGHDENISFEQMAKIVGEKNAEQLRSHSIDLYQRGAEYAASKGIIVADTKFEFGDLDGKIILIDEVLTPDSSRFWPTEGYEPGHDQPSFDKQIVRNYLLGINWDQKPPGPELPDSVIQKTSAAYREIYERLSGKKVSS